MTLQYRYEKIEDVPAGLREHYLEQNGNFVLAVDGVVDRSQFEDFRKENQSLHQQLDETRKRFEGIEPEAVRALEAEKRELAEQQALKAGEVEKVIESRLKSVQTVHQKQMRDLAQERDALVARLSEIQIDQGVVTVATLQGLLPTAVPDITARARATFKLVNGMPVAVERDGKTPRIGKDGGAMGVEDWVTNLVAQAPHLFERGGDGSGSPGLAGIPTEEKGGPNPFRKETWNVTEQMKLLKADPVRAERMKANAKG
jgi:hypothetical protein